MRARILVPATIALLIAVGAVASGAFGKTGMSPMMYTAKLNIAQEVPKESGAPSNAGGTFSATLHGSTLKWKLTYHNLTGPATAAHIHMGKKGQPGGVIVPLCGTNCKSGISGSTKVSASVMKALNGADAYVNVHTAKNPNGEIRGQVM